MSARVYRMASAIGFRIDPSDPYAVALAFLIAELYAHGQRTLHHHRGVFYAWNGSAYLEITKDEVRSWLYAFLDRCIAGAEQGQKVKPNTALVNNVSDALTAQAELENAISAPCWLNDDPGLPAPEIIACKNGLLYLPRLALLPHTPNFFTHNALDYAFDPESSPPAQWLEFLRQLWPDDPESIATLQEMFGYCLTSDTSQQKAFLMIGPKRSGKGTIGRVLTALLGPGNVAAPTLSSLSQNFGLAPLIDKPLAIIGDARLDGRANQHAIAERLLSITGEDAITVDRKYLTPWTGRLPVRFLIISNELPRLADASGALASRFIALVMRESFYGHEDHGLFNRLWPELPGILNWAITGRQRLKDRGYFIMPASSMEAVKQFEDLGSPIGAFVREKCIVAAGRTVEMTTLFVVWCDWCKQQNRHPGTAEQFGKNLRAAVPGIKGTQPRAETGRIRLYDGIGLKSSEGK
jgi:putative DNA primase/helicase